MHRQNIIICYQVTCMKYDIFMMLFSSNTVLLLWYETRVNLYYFFVHALLTRTYQRGVWRARYRYDNEHESTTVTHHQSVKHICRRKSTKTNQGTYIDARVISIHFHCYLLLCYYCCWKETVNIYLDIMSIILSS